MTVQSSFDLPISTPASLEPIISLQEVHKTYYRGDLGIEVLHGISLDIYPGEFVAIMGASGSGKTTLMNLIGCLDKPTAGTYQLSGVEVTQLDADERALLRRETFGFIFQQYNLLATATALENVEVPAIYTATPRSQRLTRAAELLTTLGLGERLDHRPNQLSGGQQQRVSIARALMNGGAVILADEPTGALDSKSGQEVMDLLRDLNARGHTVMLITHEPNVAKQARRVIEIKDGEIVSDSGSRKGNMTTPVVKSLHSALLARRIGVPDVTEAGHMAIRSLRTNIMRTMLTLLGIIIGVASVVAMLAIGNGAKQEVLSRISAMGTDLLLIRPGAKNIRLPGGFRANLVPADADAVATLPNVKEAIPEYSQRMTLRYGANDYITDVNSTTEGYPRARNWDVTEGTFFTDADVKSYAPVIVLGTTVVSALFAEGEDPIDKYVVVNNNPFQVIGVMADKGANTGGQDQDDTAFTPFSTGSVRLFGQRHAKSITVQVDDVDKIDATQDAITSLLIARHQIQDFQIRNMAAIIEAATQTQDTLTLLLGSIAAISLLVGGIGVMNIMLVSVTERTREIGVRMATGARKLNILLQFNTEALVVCAIGGVVGIFLGFATAGIFAHFGKPIELTAGPVVLAFGCAFATGLLFGYLPARKAANLDPVIALGAE